MYICPSRRQSRTYPNAGNYNYHTDIGDVTPTNVARSDYAANCGNQSADEVFGGPPDLATGDNPGYGWPNTAGFDGVVFQRSVIRMPGDIPNGTSNVYMLGEKYLNPDAYYTGTDGGDNENMYVGFDNDISRCSVNVPMQDKRGYGNTFIWGSNHVGGLNMVFCDGSVRVISYSIDLPTHQAQGSRY
jgi:prepilin-type processing-associated H-X9-DG protein